ncbi:protein takeout-like [Lycorma delicatula]|uniref:protein takeout-like n=1 Tax=Lycorma delicatula TaxID=130591 RepID=UPI003F50E375
MMSIRVNAYFFNVLLYIFYCLIENNAAPADSNKISNCLAKDASINECVKKAGEALLKKANKEHKNLGIPLMDPWTIPKMTLHNGNGAVSLNLEIIDGKHTGFSKSQITQVNAHPEKYEFEVTLLVPNYEITGQYNVSGKIIMLPIAGTGPCHIRFNDISGTWKFKGEPFAKNNKKYAKLTDFKVTLSTKKMQVKLDNLFNGNKQLGDTMNSFLNENWEEVFQILKPSMEANYARLLMESGNKALSRVEYKTLFPDVD